MILYTFNHNEYNIKADFSRSLFLFKTVIMILLLFLFFISHASRYPLLIPEIKSKISYFLADKNSINTNKRFNGYDFFDRYIAFLPETYRFSFDCIKLNEERVEIPSDFCSCSVDFSTHERFSVLVRNDAYNIKGYFSLSHCRAFYAFMNGCFRNVKEAEFCCWDAYCDRSYLYAAIATDHYITFLSVSNIFGFHAQRELFSYYYDKKIDQRQSLCFHNRIDQKIVSLISQNFMKIFSLDSKRLLNDIFCPLFDVFKHEYIGAGTYLLLSDYKLFFAEIKNNNLNYYKQTIKDKNGKELSVQNFAVNHEYKTDSARARFFVVVANNQLFLFDLLERYKNRVLKMQKLTDSLVQEDELSFVENNIFCLNKTDCNRYCLSYVTLPSFWAVKKMFENERFSESEANNGKQKNCFLKKIYNFLYEQKYFILPWLLSSYYIYYRFHYNKSFLRLLFLTYYLNIVIWTIFDIIFISDKATPALAQKVILPFLPLHIILPLLPLKIRNFIRYGVWS